LLGCRGSTTCSTANTGVDEYGRIEETFAPAALEQIATWLESRVKGRQ